MERRPLRAREEIQSAAAGYWNQDGPQLEVFLDIRELLIHIRADTQQMLKEVGEINHQTDEVMLWLKKDR